MVQNGAEKTQKKKNGKKVTTNKKSRRIWEQKPGILCITAIRVGGELITRSNGELGEARCNGQKFAVLRYADH